MDGLVATLIPLFRLGAVVLVGRLAGITAVSARRVEILILVVVSLRHRLPPFPVPVPF
jgi:hypothetical protein